MTKIAVGIVTLQRPDHLARLLADISAQTFKDGTAPDLTVLVVDNDAAGSARAVCDRARATGQNVVYVQEPVRGIPVARNRVLVSLPDGCEWLAVINDRGSPASDWLAVLLRTALESEADIVIGATEAVLPDKAPAWISRGGFFNRRRFIDYATLSEGASNNCLLRVSALTAHALRYNETLREHGGSDTFFFREAARNGLRMVWEANAIVREHIPAERCTARWLWRRNMRDGNTLALCDLAMDGSTGWMRRFGRATQKLLQGLISLPLCIAGWHELMRSLLMIARALGMYAGLAGWRLSDRLPESPGA